MQLQLIEIDVTKKGNPVIDLKRLGFIGAFGHNSMPKLTLYETDDNAIIKPHNGLLLAKTDNEIYRMVKLCRTFKGDINEAKRTGNISYSILLTPSQITAKRLLELKNMRGIIKC